jgi:hypothetical protein
VPTRQAGLVKSLPGQPPGPGQDEVDPGRVGAVGVDHGVEGVELEHQGTQAVGQHIVDLPGDAGSLRQTGGPLLLPGGPLPLGQSQLGLGRPHGTLPPADPDGPQQDGDQRQRQVAQVLVGDQDGQGGGDGGGPGQRAALHRGQVDAAVQCGQGQQADGSGGRVHPGGQPGGDGA